MPVTHLQPELSLWCREKYECSLKTDSSLQRAKDESTLIEPGDRISGKGRQRTNDPDSALEFLLAVGYF